jgi:uncharacterized membrane protein
LYVATRSFADEESEIDMLKRLAFWATIIVALLHLAFMVLEASQWSTELGQRLTHLSASAAGGKS